MRTQNAKRRTCRSWDASIERDFLGSGRGTIRSRQRRWRAIDHNGDRGRGSRRETTHRITATSGRGADGIDPQASHPKGCGSVGETIHRPCPSPMPGRFAVVSVGSGKTDRRHKGKFKQALDPAGRGVWTRTRPVEKKRRRTIEVSKRTAPSSCGRDTRKFQAEGRA